MTGEGGDDGIMRDGARSGRQVQIQGTEAARIHHTC